MRCCEGGRATAVGWERGRGDRLAKQKRQKEKDDGHIDLNANEQQAPLL